MRLTRSVVTNVRKKSFMLTLRIMEIANWLAVSNDITINTRVVSFANHDLSLEYPKPILPITPHNNEQLKMNGFIGAFSSKRFSCAADPLERKR